MKNKMTKGKKKAEDRYQKLSEEEEEERKHQYHREHNKNISKEEKEMKVEYMRNYYLSHEKTI